MDPYWFSNGSRGGRRGEGEGEGDRDLIVVSEATFDRCVPSPEALRILSAVQETVVRLTVTQRCHWTLAGGGDSCGIEPGAILTTRTEGGAREYLFTVAGLESAASLAADAEADADVGVNRTCSHDAGAEAECTSDRPPLVTADRIDLLHEFLDKDVVKYVAGFKNESGDQSLLQARVGLTLEYVANGLHIPLSCYLRILVFELLQFFLESFLAYPAFFTGVSVVMYIAYSIKHRRRRAARFRTEVNRLEKMSLDHLADLPEGKGYGVLHLRDELGYKLHPDSKRRRKDLYEQVWPLVLVAVRQDNRVKKSIQPIGGKTMEYWEWVSPLRKEHKSAVPTRNGGNGAEATA